MLKLGQNYDLLCNMIIRPPRFIYDISDLGPRYFSAGGKSAQRTDFELRNGRGMIIQCSHFEPLTSWDKPMPCVIYLHGNGGCRIEALDVVHTLLPADVSVLALDFAGSGLSEGEYVSLGAWEQWDVATAVKYLRDAGRCSTIGLWGRSMGAVTAILYSMQDPSIASIILDSPFCSLQKIAEDLVLNVETLQKVPRFTKFAVGIAMKAIRSTIKKKAKFDVRSLEILEMVPKCFIPALFIHGKDDNFVLPLHSELLYNSYSGEKNRVLVAGNHNSVRPSFFMDSAVIFFHNTLHSAAEAHMPLPPQPTPPLPSSSLPSSKLPASIPQQQAAIQLQQLSEILHNQPSPCGAVTQQLSDTVQAQVLQQGLSAAQTQATAQAHAHEASHAQSNSGLSRSVVIDDMVIGNTVVIDGKTIVLDEDDDYYTPSTPTTTLSSTPSSTSSLDASSHAPPAQELARMTLHEPQSITPSSNSTHTHEVHAQPTFGNLHAAHAPPALTQEPDTQHTRSIEGSTKEEIPKEIEGYTDEIQGESE